jgi:hypothetical protein
MVAIILLIIYHDKSQENRLDNLKKLHDKAIKNKRAKLK